MLVMAAVNGFFSGRGQTWTVLGIEAFGTAVNIAAGACVLIFGRWGFPEMGIEGAGWATVAGSWAAALLGGGTDAPQEVPRRVQHGSRLEAGARTLRPADEVSAARRGCRCSSTCWCSTLFTQLVGRLGDAALGATTLTVRLNMIAFLPMMGLGQAICIMVGQRLGENRPDLAEKSTYTGLKWSFGYMCLVALAYVASRNPGLALPAG